MIWTSQNHNVHAKRKWLFSYSLAQVKRDCQFLSVNVLIISFDMILIENIFVMDFVEVFSLLFILEMNFKSNVKVYCL